MFFSNHRACASASIIVHTFVCLFVHAWASVSTHACDSGIICDCSCCSVCLSVILYNILLWGDLGHGYTAAHVYIQIYIKDYLYHSLESPECCSLQWLGDKICIQLSRWALFKWKVPVFITILYKELFHSGLLCLLRDWLFIILFHENSTHVILVELDLLHCISLSLNEVSQPQALRQSVVWFHYLGLSWAPPIFFCFLKMSIIDPDPMDIIALLLTFQSWCASKDALTNHLRVLMLLTFSMIGRWRVTLMYLITLKIFPLSSLSKLLTQVHRKVMAVMVSFLALDMTNSSCATVWWNAASWSLSISVCLSSGLTLNIWIANVLVLLHVMTTDVSYRTPFR